MSYVLIVGRPNVGKSSLFNVLTSRKIAIVAEVENTTRDIIEYQVQDEASGLKYTIADSGGLNPRSKQSVLKDVNNRVARHMEKADIIVFIVEYNNITNVDQEILRTLRKSGKRIFLAANKADNESRIQESYELTKLGIIDIFPMSCSHKTGISELQTAIIDHLKTSRTLNPETPDDGSIKVALIGRPNVGKSSIFNSLVGENRVMVQDEAGTTRDATDTKIEFEGKDITIIDTAGLRKPGKIGTYNIESWSVLRTQEAIRRSDVCAIVLDPIEGITQNDKKILETAANEKKGVILVINKWDLANEDTDFTRDELEKRYLIYLQKQLPFMPWASTVFCVATEHKNTTEILEHVIGIYNEREKRIPTSKFNNFLEMMVHNHPPRGRLKSHRPKVYYGSQVDIHPPKFMISVNKTEHFHFSWRRYLENKIREHFGFFGTPLEFNYKGKPPRKDKEDTEKDFEVDDAGIKNENPEKQD